MTNIDTTVVNIALDTLTRDFEAAVTGVQWVATGYLLALAVDHPARGMGDGPVRRQARLGHVDHAVPRRLDAGGSGLVARAA